MVLLALDTTAGSCSVALLCEGRISVRCADAGTAGPPAHSQLLLPMIDGLLAESGTPLRALDAIAFGAGPGSFTGLRIACGVAQGLAFALDRPVVPVDALASMAWESGQPAVIACLDARMGEVYAGAYRIAHLPDAPDGPCAMVETVLAPCVCAPGAVPVPAAVTAGPGWTGCGNGFQVHAGALAVRLPGLSARDAGVMPGARAVAALAAIALRAGHGLDAALAAPLYVRDKVALDAAEQALLRAGGRRAASAAGRAA
jgi:tRNA threonylcarbamoyladenosine biosynthesis protein TsaB